MDVLNNASMGTGFGCGAEYATPSILPLLLNGIIVAYGAKIGENCRQNKNIGANAVMCMDIPSNCTAMGIPARIISKSDSVLSSKKETF